MRQQSYLSSTRRTGWVPRSAPLGFCQSQDTQWITLGQFWASGWGFSATFLQGCTGTVSDTATSMAPQGLSTQESPWRCRFHVGNKEHRTEPELIGDMGGSSLPITGAASDPHQGHPGIASPAPQLSPSPGPAESPDHIRRPGSLPAHSAPRLASQGSWWRRSGSLCGPQSPSWACHCGRGWHPGQQGCPHCPPGQAGAG